MLITPILYGIEYLRRENCNFIAVDWSELAAGIEYPIIVQRDVPRAAKRTGSEYKLSHKIAVVHFLH